MFDHGDDFKFCRIFVSLQLDVLNAAKPETVEPYTYNLYYLLYSAT